MGCAYLERTSGWCRVEGCNAEAGPIIDGGNGLADCELFRGPHVDSR
jgi:hypothetical protein